MAKASEEGLGPKWAVVPLLMMMMMKYCNRLYRSELAERTTTDDSKRTQYV
jgi:hypothetical protein